VRARVLHDEAPPDLALDDQVEPVEAIDRAGALVAGAAIYWFFVRR
jgi:hypothetical protein